MKIDLFEYPENLPTEIQSIFEKYEESTYENCNKLLDELKPFGFTFNYGLDSIQYELEYKGDLYKIQNNKWIITNEEITEDTKLCLLYSDDLKPYAVGIF